MKPFHLEAVMKDAVHHLKHVQKKVIQEARKSSGGAKPFTKEGPNNTSLVDENLNSVRYAKSTEINQRVSRFRNNRSLAL